MRIFKDCKEMISEVHRDLFEMGIRVNPKTMQDKFVEGDENYQTIELSGYSFAILNTDDLDQMIMDRKLSLVWCEADFRERINPEEINPGQAYTLRSEWDEFVHGGKFAYTYNERIRYQLEDTINILKFDPNTRQAVLTIYEGMKDTANRGGKNRVPCSMYYQFLIRDGKLDVIYTMRSSDFMTHFPYDIWMAARLRDLIAKEVEVPVGKLIFFSGSLHCYKKDMPETF